MATKGIAEEPRGGQEEATAPPSFGDLLRHWRVSRHLSQLDLALEAEVSARHVSFLETGRALPSREMLLTLANVLDVPLRERNVLLQAAGFAPVYRETSLDDPRMSHVRAALELILTQHDPRSALAFDRHWDIVMVNASYVRFLSAVLGRVPSGLSPLTVTRPPRLNLLELVFDPHGVRKVIVNWEPIAKALLNEAYHSAAWACDPVMRERVVKILAYPGVPARWREPDLDSSNALILPFELNLNGRIARMFSTVTTLGRPQDVTLQELYIEAFFPADAESEWVNFARQ
jgi:transcriptional regulator with XRE-family HTH domain